MLLSFHPFASTSVCAKQMQALEKYKRKLDELNTVAVGLSVDSVPCKTAWVKSFRIKKTRLLADFWPHGGVAKAMGLFRKEGFSERANVIADELGRIIFVKVYPIRELPDMKELLRVLTDYKNKEQIRSAEMEETGWARVETYSGINRRDFFKVGLAGMTSALMGWEELANAMDYAQAG